MRKGTNPYQSKGGKDRVGRRGEKIEVEVAAETQYRLGERRDEKDEWENQHRPDPSL